MSYATKTNYVNDTEIIVLHLAWLWTNLKDPIIGGNVFDIALILSGLLWHFLWCCGHMIPVNIRPHMEQHVEKVAAKINRSLGLIKRTVTTSSSEAKRVSPKTLVQPLIEYGAWITDSQLWLSHMVRFKLLDLREVLTFNVNFHTFLLILGPLRSDWPTRWEQTISLGGVIHHAEVSFNSNSITIQF